MDPTLLSDSAVMQSLASLGSSLAALATKSTVAMVSAKMTEAKEAKNADTVRRTYEELINQLVDERAEAIRIAQAYKAELDRVQISDEDIESLNATIGRVLDIFGMDTDSAHAFDTEEDDQQIAFQQLRQLISSDTLRTMQLLGFNFKAAIGEPLTELCATKIRELGSSKAGSNGGGGNGRRRKTR